MRRFLLIVLLIFVLISCKSKTITTQDFNIEIQEPEFEVISIIILQADLVVTKFETVLRIKNPNIFAVDLSSITYELYGNNAFWAGGSENINLTIAPFGSGETRFIFDMNFINMNRRLLDDVIAMRQVNYRFKGTAEIQPDITSRHGTRIQSFIMNYDCSGRSEVRRR